MFLTIAGAARAALSAYEPFNYIAGSLPNGTAATGTGLAGNWTCGSAASIVTGLAYPGLPVAGNALSSGASRQFVSLAAPLSSGTKWISFLLTASANTGGNVDGVFFPNSQTSCLWFGWGLTPYSSTQGGFALGSLTTAGTAAQPATSLLAMGLGTYSATTLVVLRIDFNTAGTNDTITVYTNPVAGVSAPGFSAAGTCSNFDVGTISGIGLNVQGAANITIDEVRVGDTYGDVVGYVGVPPNPPTGVTATPGVNQVALGWTAATGNPATYNVKRGTASAGPFTTVGAVTAPAVAYTDAVPGGQTYYYEISAVNPGGESSNSSPAVAATPTLGIPPAPTGLTATAGNAQVSLAWTGNSFATSYHVKRAAASAGPYTPIATTPAPTVVYTDSAVANGATYYYVVSALNGAGESGNSSPVSGTPGAAPSAPTGVTATPGSNQVSLTWTASAGGPASYNVKRAAVAAGPFTTIGTTTAPSVAYTDSGLISGTTYYYVVSAVNGAGESANSSPPLSATPVGGPGIFFNLSVTGPTSQRLNFVLLAEGYTTNQVAQFTNDAHTLLNSIFSHTPYNEYTNYFNVYAIFVPSVDAGASHPNSNIVLNTYFHSDFDSYDTERLVTIPPNNWDNNPADGEEKMQALLASWMPEYDLTAIVINDQEYGGSGGYVICTSMNSQSPEIVVHESGHTLGSLADEYADAGTGYFDESTANITQQTNRALIKWNAWINAATPVPTPTTYTTAVGLFQGANYSTNWYRAQLNCEMRALGYPFCAICAEQMVKSIYGYVTPINTCSPATNSLVQVPAAGSAAFTAIPNQPSTHNLSLQWYLNAVALPGATNTTFHLAASALTPGTNTLKVAVRDATPLVRSDPDQLLTDARTWSVTVAAAPPLLNIARLPGQVVLSWPTSAVTFTLASSPDLPGALWTSNPVTPVVAGSVYQVTNPLTGTRQYFRLQK